MGDNLHFRMATVLSLRPRGGKIKFLLDMLLEFISISDSSNVDCSIIYHLVSNFPCYYAIDGSGLLDALDAVIPSTSYTLAGLSDP